LKVEKLKSLKVERPKSLKVVAKTLEESNVQKYDMKNEDRNTKTINHNAYIDFKKTQHTSSWRFLRLEIATLKVAQVLTFYQ